MLVSSFFFLYKLAPYLLRDQIMMLSTDTTLHLNFSNVSENSLPCRVCVCVCVCVPEREERW